MRVHELAKELKTTSKEIIEKLTALKIEAKSHMSVLTDEQLKKFKESQAPKKAEEKKPAPVVASKQGEGSRPASSIDLVKQQLMAQRTAAKTVQTTEVKKPKSEPVTTSINTPRKPMAPAAIKPRPVFEPKKIIRPTTPEVLVPGIPVVAAAPAQVRPARKIELGGAILVKDLAVKFNLNPSELISRLIKQGVFANINQSINLDQATKLAVEMGFEIVKPQAQEVAVAPEKPAPDKTKTAVRAPIVTFMGHVDHGKTSLLDAIRKTKVAAGEAGGITQHIGAYEVFLPKGAVTFLDTPGHEAFTAMRARGARATDVVVLVVAADDGVMPQTIEAIDHAKAANVPIIVAINKIDLPAANPDRVKKGLIEHGLMPEDWGGKTIMVGVSAKTGKGIDDLLEMLVLESELLELRANPDAPANGVVVEAELSKGSGVLATLLVQDGTLRVGDFAVVGNTYCKVRAMINDRGVRVKEALPSMPVEILGLDVVPKAGDRFNVVKDEKRAKEIVDQMQDAARLHGDRTATHMSLEHLSEEVRSGKVSELKLIVKSDVQGSVEALRSTLGKIQAKNVKLNFIHTGIGEISESDVMLAAASDAVIIGFHIGITSIARDLAEKEAVDVRFYEIIYEVKTAIEKAMEGLLEPELKEIVVGTAEVRQVFKVSKAGMIAGCAVIKGKIVRNFHCRVIRNGQKIHDGKVESLKRFKDDAREVLEGFECGIGVSNFEELVAGDRIEAYEIQKKERKLE